MLWHLSRDMWRNNNPKALIYFCINHGDQRFFQNEITINVLVSSFRFIWISTLHYCGVYGHYKYFILSVQLRTSKYDVYRRQILTSKVGQRWKCKNIDIVFKTAVLQPWLPLYPLSWLVPHVMIYSLSKWISNRFWIMPRSMSPIPGLTQLTAIYYGDIKMHWLIVGRMSGHRLQHCSNIWPT